tara:strand:- start:39 stop:1493 length:1455 start_codon:yes stop_codon:yes gene_type:complete
MTLTQITEKGIKDGEIINADINASAAIAKSKLASLDIVNADINASAAVAGTKISPNFGSQAITTTGAANAFAINVTGDNQDSLNFTGTASNNNRGIAFNNKTALSHSNDSILRINNNLEFNTVGILGNVGISTTSPSRRLQIKSAGNNATQIGLIDVDSTNEVFQVGQQADGDCFIALRTDDGTATVSLDASGNTYFNGGDVGIGTTSPEARFHVKHATTNAVADFESGDANVSIRFKDSATVNRPAIGATGDNLTLTTGNLERVHINGSNGRVGIGEAAPGSPLHVYHATTNESIRCKSGDEFVHIGFEDSTTTNVPYMGAQGNNLRFITGGAERLRVQSGGGISFNADTAAANALDDYEEGSWSATSLNYDYDGNQAQRGHYVKIGRIVHAFFRVKFHNQSNYTGQHLRFTGLPFTAASGNPYDVGVSGFAHGYSSIDFFRIYVQPGASYAYWYTSTGSNFNNSTSLNSADVRGCITYTASA